MTVDTEDISPPATPPTHSPIPHRLSLESCSLLSQCDEKDHLSHLITSFQHFTPTQKQIFLYEIINHCDNNQLTFLNSLIAPRLKVDFLKELPLEIALHILSYIDSPATLGHAARISKYWNSLIKDETLWRILCKRHQYTTAQDDLRIAFSFRDHFKRQHSIYRAWGQGGKVTTVDGGFSQGLVTSLQFDEKYTVVGCDNHRIEVFDTNSGKKIRTLEGHEGGVWALQFKGGEQDDPERVLLSGGCDR
ncbi:hypothetical protein G6F56_008924 [Rhizopus delemar]|nr:hypothetical protein G6F56_008924 [Rhizopus delemar]